MIKFVTGNSGEKHITSADDGALYAAIAGSGLVVFGTGLMFRASMVSSSVVRIDDGEGMVDGRHFRIEPGDYVEVKTADGVSGYNRNDLVLLHYVRKNGLETLSLEVVAGEYSTGEAADPTYEKSEIGIIGGASDVYTPMFRIRRSGTSTPTVEPMFSVRGAHAVTRIVYAASVPASGWTEQADHTFTQTVSVDGITSGDAGHVDLDMSAVTVDAASNVQQSWALVGRVETVDGGIRLTAYSGAPEDDMKLTVEVMR